MIERMRVKPWGVFGGEDGAPFRVTLVRGRGRTRMRGKENRDLARGDLVIVESSGGGGYGPPAERPTDLRAWDRANGYTARRGRGSA